MSNPTRLLYIQWIENIEKHPKLVIFNSYFKCTFKSSEGIFIEPKDNEMLPFMDFRRYILKTFYIGSYNFGNCVLIREINSGRIVNKNNADIKEIIDILIKLSKNFPPIKIKEDEEPPPYYEKKIRKKKRWFNKFGFFF